MAAYSEPRSVLGTEEITQLTKTDKHWMEITFFVGKGKEDSK